MFKVRKIVYPTDFSRPSEVALPHAREMARLWRARIVLLHVRRPLGTTPEEPLFEFESEDEYDRFLQDSCRKMKERLRGDGISVETVIVKNDSPAIEILDYAETERVDLIVMGTLGRRRSTCWSWRLMGRKVSNGS